MAVCLFLRVCMNHFIEGWTRLTCSCGNNELLQPKVNVQVLLKNWELKHRTIFLLHGVHKYLYALGKKNINIICSHTHSPVWRRFEMGAIPSPWPPPLNSDADNAATQFVAIATKERMGSVQKYNQPISHLMYKGTKKVKDAGKINTTKQTVYACVCESTFILHHHQGSHRPAPPADSGST